MSVVRKYTIAGDAAFTLQFRHNQTTLDRELLGMNFSESGDASTDVVSEFDTKDNPPGLPLALCKVGCYDADGNNLTFPDTTQVKSNNKWETHYIGDVLYASNGKENLTMRTVEPRLSPANDDVTSWTEAQALAGDFDIHDEITDLKSNTLNLGSSRKWAFVKLAQSSSLAMVDYLKLKLGKEVLSPEYPAQLKIYYFVPSIGYLAEIHTVKWADITAGGAEIIIDYATLEDRYTGPWPVMETTDHYLVFEYVPDYPDDASKQPDIKIYNDTRLSAGTTGAAYLLDSDGKLESTPYTYAGPTTWYIFADFKVLANDYANSGTDGFALVAYALETLNGAYETELGNPRRIILPDGTDTTAGYMKTYPLAAIKNTDFALLNVYRSVLGETGEDAVFFLAAKIPYDFIPEDGEVDLLMAGGDTWLSTQVDASFESRDAQVPYTISAYWKRYLLIAQDNFGYWSVPGIPERIDLGLNQHDFDGQHITGIGILPEALVWFHESGFFRMTEADGAFFVENLNDKGIGTRSHRSIVTVQTNDGTFLIFQDQVHGHFWATNGRWLIPVTWTVLDETVKSLDKSKLELTEGIFNPEANEILWTCATAGSSINNICISYSTILKRVNHTETMPASVMKIDPTNPDYPGRSLLIGAREDDLFYHYHADDDLGSPIGFRFRTPDYRFGDKYNKKDMPSFGAMVAGQAGQTMSIFPYKDGVVSDENVIDLGTSFTEEVIRHLGRAFRWGFLFTNSDSLGPCKIQSISPEPVVIRRAKR